uniref:SnoaL-like domain-containing protein n=1 Tax=Aplanochytrium stocchinoi TaxID=215587 RepID=A0A7S3PKU2_9STRA|mmetsp:Transcript_2053/g.2641  ORF Transcript_2053/g.2641 Transcript_2053/m.2641 type:complete len:161 (-) Transcript_2053:591-1073(-)|eukprot:CAMPEP_0204836760 /NCGR_PEP_ID=MMETSP1346-20131115/26082_1 /ASSEMBLY_ACC=CAM_ASM_000771 /TAXON_ID=215587 /ORGANISM="Aplanochytrium stocchinoi, Strain GSBS06" /LENGTH=160 /DNA_ID=CAMNT_0051971735 /DNA_START=101 /DNA_END=583 /DNA_ORIENTATION=+
MKLTEIVLKNGCSEEGCAVNSDSELMTDFVRKHYLLHFGHRNLEAILSDYDENAVIHSVVNGEYNCFRGSAEISQSFRNLFSLHVAGKSSFQLKQIVVEAGTKQSMGIWTAQTPNLVFKQGHDTFQFNDQGKIISQMYVATVSPTEGQEDNDAFAMAIMD